MSECPAIIPYASIKKKHKKQTPKNKEAGNGHVNEVAFVSPLAWR
jgi:hypothetical protein